MKNNSDLFFTCSLIEFIARERKLKRKEAVEYLGMKQLKQIYNYAGTFHCEPIAKVADDFIEIKKIPMGEFDNVGSCQYTVPDYWTIGEVYERLIEDVGGDIVATLISVYSSWISDAISNYNSDFYYQSREYIYECYKVGQVL